MGWSGEGAWGFLFGTKVLMPPIDAGLRLGSLMLLSRRRAPLPPEWCPPPHAVAPPPRTTEAIRPITPPPPPPPSHLIHHTHPHTRPDDSGRRPVPRAGAGAAAGGRQGAPGPGGRLRARRGHSGASTQQTIAHNPPKPVYQLQFYPTHMQPRPQPPTTSVPAAWGIVYACLGIVSHKPACLLPGVLLMSALVSFNSQSACLLPGLSCSPTPNPPTQRTCRRRSPSRRSPPPSWTAMRWWPPMGPVRRGASFDMCLRTPHEQPTPPSLSICRPHPPNEQANKQRPPSLSIRRPTHPTIQVFTPSSGASPRASTPRTEVKRKKSRTQPGHSNTRQALLCGCQTMSNRNIHKAPPPPPPSPSFAAAAIRLARLTLLNPPRPPLRCCCSHPRRHRHGRVHHHGIQAAAGGRRGEWRVVPMMHLARTSLLLCVFDTL